MQSPAQFAPAPRTWKITLAYDGTDFFGWQVQPGKATIQGELQSALARITGELLLPQGSGRTDAGVHALAQVASFALRAPIPAENLRRALNRTLPPSIRISTVRVVPSTFHARHSACAKTYEYRVFSGGECAPFLARYVYPYRWALNFDALRAAAQLIVGEHDFRSFAARDPDLTARAMGKIVEQRSGYQDSTVRSIYASDWERRASGASELWVYRVRGNGFLHHMVRNLVGTMLDVGRGLLRAEDLAGILEARSRAEAGATAPARGLFLDSVEYPPVEESPIAE